MAASIYLSVLLFLTCFNSLTISQNASSSDVEKQVLLQLKEEWGNPTSLDSWSSSTATPHCSWLGINCSSDGFINRIVLSHQNLNNTIHSSICSLANLSYLDLSFNNMTGSFPTTFYNCSALEYLDISQNLYSGVLPSDIDNLSSKLTTLCLSANNFEGSIPASIGRLQALQYLWLDYNVFDGTFPVELSNLTDLQTLTLANNPFVPATIPPQFGSLTKLSFLWMRQMNLTGAMPIELSNMKSMIQLDLSQNSLTGTVPAGIWNLQNLTYLYLYTNNLSGPITVDGAIGASGLVEIDLSMNQINGSIPEQFGSLQNLTVLFMYYNKLSGEIPTSIGLLPSLRDLRLFNNSLTGVLPAELGQHSPLWNIEVDNNMILGEIPENLCAYGRFTSIVVFNNKMTGKIPASLGNCSTLNDFQIYKNQFYGEVPQGLWSAVNLTTVLMHDNALTGTIPGTLPWNLTRLEIQNNKFSGNIPSSGTKLAVFKASNNSFTGEFPDFSKLTRLQTLLLGANSISGQIPEEISLLTSLYELNISNNQLSGEIPTSIGSLPVLTTLDLSVNDLSGTIPSTINNLKLNFLNLSSNQLSGEIPSSLDNQAYNESFLSNPKLCASNSLLNVRTCRSGSSGISRGVRISLIVLGALVVLIVGMFITFVVRDCRKRNDSDNLANWKLTSFQPVNFSEANILGGLKPENLIGSGGSGEVYKINIRNREDVAVAVKKIWSARKLDSKIEKQFESEIQILSRIRHNNIVKLLCCISSPDSKLLVYEYMENDSLHFWLHRKLEISGSQRRHLMYWPNRLRIAIGVAQGLSYMHHDCSPPIIHRDIKSSNILLDSELNARIADFGLARLLLKNNEPETMSAVAGSFGYIAPECAYSMKINEKADVYSFGVVLLELTTGREASNGGKHSNLADWAWRHLQEGSKVAEVLDSEIKEPSYISEMETVFRLGVMCTNTLPSTRPSMKEALQILLHVSTKNCVGDKKYVEHDFAPLLNTKRVGSKKISDADSLV